MDNIGGPANQRSLVDRVRNILLTPREEWARIDAEPSSIGGIYRSYVVPLAAIGPVCMVIGLSLFGMFAFRFPIAWLISQAIVQYVMTLVMVYVVALVIDLLAPNFGGTPNRLAAFKVAAYSATASWVAGVLALVPPLAPLGIIAGLYSLYLLYLGLPRLMKAPQDKAVAYIAVVIVVLIVAALIIGAVTAPLTRLFVGDPFAVNAGFLR